MEPKQCCILFKRGPDVPRKDKEAPLQSDAMHVQKKNNNYRELLGKREISHTSRPTKDYRRSGDETPTQSKMRQASYIAAGGLGD